jgi:hypothetical protein
MDVPVVPVDKQEQTREKVASGNRSLPVTVPGNLTAAAGLPGQNRKGERSWVQEMVFSPEPWKDGVQSTVAIG